MCLDRSLKNYRDEYECELFGKESSMLVFAILQTKEPPHLEERLSKLAGIYEAAKLTHWLGQGIVSCLKYVRVEDFSSTQLQTIQGVVHDLAASHEALQMPSRIFRTGLKYLATGDESTFYDLLKSERDILLQALRLENNEA